MATAGRHQSMDLGREPHHVMASGPDPVIVEVHGALSDYRPVGCHLCGEVVGGVVPRPELVGRRGR